MKNNMMKNNAFRRALCALLVLTLGLALSGCGSARNDAPPKSLSFSAANSMEEIAALNGQPVTIVGYMATLSPISGKYMYLMNMPYQSCPFCVPNTTQLANTMAVYAPAKSTFTYTDQAVRVTGTMKVEDYTDEYGYSYNYRIVDATCEVVDLSAVSQEYALWQSIAADGVVGEVNSMFDYLYFLTHWPSYQATATDEDGTQITYYLYAGDVTRYLADDSAYGYADKCNDTYFPGLLKRIRAISDTALEDLTAIVADSDTLAQYALAQLNDGQYTYDETADQFALNDADNLDQQWNDLWMRFSDWLAKWEV